MPPDLRSLRGHTNYLSHMTLTLPRHPYVSVSVLFLHFPRHDVVAGHHVYRDRRLAAVSGVYLGRRLRLCVVVADRVLL
jgi:hypothetical protein